jgi:hypothetical protein
MKKLDRSFAVLALVLVAAAGAVSAGCGESPPDLTPYLGTWTVSASAITVLCDDNTVKAITVTNPVVMVKGTQSDLIDADTTCPILYDVSDGAAQALPDQSCNNPDVITAMHLLKGSFKLDKTANMATLAASGKLDGYINISSGNTVFCTFNEMGVYRRSGL